MCYVGICNEGRCSSMAIGLSNDGKWVFNKACTMPWCHTVGHFEVKMNRFHLKMSHVSGTRRIEHPFASIS